MNAIDEDREDAMQDRERAQHEIRAAEGERLLKEATPETHKRSALYMLVHDEWCSHDETDDGIACDCHLSAIATLRARLEALERLRRTAELEES